MVIPKSRNQSNLNHLEGFPPGPDDGPDEPGDPPEGPKKKIKVKLADGKERQIQHMMATSFYDSDGPISSEEFINKLFGDLSKYFKTEDELIEIWSQPETRKALLESLSEAGYGWSNSVKPGKLLMRKTVISSMYWPIRLCYGSITRSKELNKAV